jgi:hypothetical protein
MRLQTEFLLKDWEVSEERYYEMLGVLPPKKMVDNAFLVGERTDYINMRGYTYELYFTEGGKYYHGGQATLNEFNLWLVPTERKCKQCNDTLEVGDDLICGYHNLEA